MDNYETVSIEVDAEVLQQVQKICAESGVSVEELIQQFLLHIVQESALLKIIAAAQLEAGVLHIPKGDAQ